MLLSTTPARRTRPVTAGILSILVITVVGACSDGEATPAETEASESTAAPAETTEATPVETGTLESAPATAETSVREALELPEREGPRRETTGSVPHVQLDSAPVPDVDAELRRRAFQIPGVEDLASDRSLPGARGLALADDLDLARADVIAGSSEFAHIHPDGSLHVWLPVDSAIEVNDKKWGELHPWVERDGFWDGVVMVYTPESLDELEVTIEIIVDAYNFVTGASLEPTDIP